MHSPAAREQALRLVRSGLNDCEVSRRTGIPRTTIRDWRRPTYVPRRATGATPADPAKCPRCWRKARPMALSAGDYAELLGLYLGDGHIVRLARTYKLRLFLDSKHGEIVHESRELLRRCFPQNAVGTAHAHQGRMTILSVHSAHLPCLLPQYGAGMKHERRILLETWQWELVTRAPWHLLKGLIRSDGCAFVNRTGRYAYLAYQLDNHSPDILDLFCATCDLVGVTYRRYARYVRINRRSSVALLRDNVGVKR